MYDLKLNIIKTLEIYDVYLENYDIIFDESLNLVIKFNEKENDMNMYLLQGSFLNIEILDLGNLVKILNIENVSQSKWIFENLSCRDILNLRNSNCPNDVYKL